MPIENPLEPMMRSFFTALLCLWGSLGLAAESAVKVAIAAPGHPELEALLIEKFGRAAGVTMLSRAELSAISRELHATPGTPSLRLAGADRLLFIEPGEGAGRSLSARVTDCATGAVIQLAQPPAALDPAATAEWLALRLSPSLRAAAGLDTRRISLLGFRFDVDSTEHRAFERRLNLAFAAALQGSGRAIGLVATDRGLAITGRGMAGFCFIPSADLDRYADSLAKNSR